MITSLHPGSAKIYQFPVGGRSNVGGRREDVNPVADLKSLGVSKASFGSGYYHEAAIQEAEQAGKR